MFVLCICARIDISIFNQKIFVCYIYKNMAICGDYFCMWLILNTQRCTPQHAVVFVCYEEVKKALARQEELIYGEDEELITINIPQIVQKSKEPRIDFTNQNSNPTNIV